jgi:hypothetical protein
MTVEETAGEGSARAKTSSGAKRGRPLNIVRRMARVPERLGLVLLREIDALEREGEGTPEGFSEARVRAVQLLAKSALAVEEAARKQEQQERETADNGDAGEGEDILAFRERLARSIAALEAEGDGGAADGGALPGGSGEARS